MKTASWTVLLASFVVFASGQESKRCPPPVAHPQTSLDKKYAQRQTFRQGDKVYYSCAEDFTPSRGSRAVECRNGQWTKLTLKCQKRTCGNAGELSNGQFVYEGESYVGERVYAVCNKGYTLKGLNYLTCKKTGWTGERPSCEVGETTCSAPAVANSMGGDAARHQVGASLTISCRQGFRLEGAQRVTCGPDGQWQPPPPRCLPSADKPTLALGRTVPSADRNTHSVLPSGCGVPPADLASNAVLADQYVTTTSFASGARVQYVCGVGYVSAGGSRYRTCRNGKWSSLILKCERRSCGSAGEILNGRFMYTGVEFGDKATAECDQGFTLVGRATRNCLSGGWDGRVPECEAAACPEPPPVANAVMEGLSEEAYTFRSVVRYRCVVGTLIGERSIACGADGTWSAPPPTCKDVTCPYPDVANAVWRAPADHRYQPRETLEFLCNPGFAMSGSQFVTCGADGHWLPELPECRPNYVRFYGRNPYRG